MKSVKILFYFYLLSLSPLVVYAQNDEIWSPVDTIYHHGINAWLNHDEDLANTCFLYLWDAMDYYISKQDYTMALKYSLCEEELSFYNYGKNSHQHALSLVRVASIYDELKLFEKELK